MWLALLALTLCAECVLQTDSNEGRGQHACRMFHIALFSEGHVIFRRMDHSSHSPFPSNHSTPSSSPCPLPPPCLRATAPLLLTSQAPRGMWLKLPCRCCSLLRSASSSVYCDSHHSVCLLICGSTVSISEMVIFLDSVTGASLSQEAVFAFASIHELWRAKVVTVYDFQEVDCRPSCHSLGYCKSTKRGRKHRRHFHPHSHSHFHFHFPLQGNLPPFLPPFLASSLASASLAGFLACRRRVCLFGCVTRPAFGRQAMRWRQ